MKDDPSDAPLGEDLEQGSHQRQMTPVAMDYTPNGSSCS